jgi:hypothetical protein
MRSDPGGDSKTHARRYSGTMDHEDFLDRLATLLPEVKNPGPKDPALSSPLMGVAWSKRNNGMMEEWNTGKKRRDISCRNSTTSHIKMTPFRLTHYSNTPANLLPAKPVF